MTYTCSTPVGLLSSYGVTKCLAFQTLFSGVYYCFRIHAWSVRVMGHRTQYSRCFSISEAVAIKMVDLFIPHPLPAVMLRLPFFTLDIMFFKIFLYGNSLTTRILWCFIYKKSKVYILKTFIISNLSS